MVQQCNVVDFIENRKFGVGFFRFMVSTVFFAIKKRLQSPEVARFGTKTRKWLILQVLGKLRLFFKLCKLCYKRVVDYVVNVVFYIVFIRAAYD